MKRIFGPPEQVLRFLALLCAVLLLATTVTLQLNGRIALSVFSAVVAAYSFSLYRDGLR